MGFEIAAPNGTNQGSGPWHALLLLSGPGSGLAVK